MFHKDFQYVTLVGIGKTDLLVPVRRYQEDRGGGFKGKFTNFPDTEISFGIAGASIPGNFTDLEVNVLLGRSQDTEITFAGKTTVAPLPSGSMLGVGTKRFKDGYQAWGVAGVCPLEDDVLAGTCGTRAGFGLMGFIPATAMTAVFQDIVDQKPVNVGKVLGMALPYLKNFKSSIARDVAFKLKPLPTDVTTLYADSAAFPTQDFAPSVGLGLKQVVTIPDLPTVSGAKLDVAIVVAGAQVPGRGLVPLGLTAGTDTVEGCTECKADTKVVGIDVVSENPLKVAYHDDGKLNLRMAPNHSGTEGSRYGVVALAIPSSGGLPNGAATTTALTMNKAAMPNGTEITFDGGFLGSVESGDYDFRAGKFSGVKLVTGATAHRAVFTADGNRRWTVYFNTADFDMPKPAKGFEDRTIATKEDRSASPNAGRSSVTYWALKAADGTKPVGMDDLFEAASGKAMNLSDYLTAFSAYGADPGLSFVAPTGAECGTNKDNPAACTVADGTYTFKVRVAGMAVPQKVKLLFEANTGEKLLVDTLTADWVAEAKFKTPLQKDDAVKTPHVITVTMVKPDATDATKTVPIDPKVSKTLQVIVAN